MQQSDGTRQENERQWLAAKAALLVLAEKLGVDEKERKAIAGAGNQKIRGDKGFLTPQIEALLQLAKSAENVAALKFSNQYSASAKEIAKRYWDQDTGRKVASLNGGALGNVVHILSIGGGAEKLANTLQDRLNYWKKINKSVLSSSDDELKKIYKSRSSRYIRPCGKARRPNSEKSGEFTHYGRYPRTVDGIDFPWRGGTNRDSILAEGARLWKIHGEKLLSAEVLDTLLDNGGEIQGDTKK